MCDGRDTTPSFQNYIQRPRWMPSEMVPFPYVKTQSQQSCVSTVKSDQILYQTIIIISDLYNSNVQQGTVPIHNKFM